MTPVPDSPRIAWFHCFAGIAGDMALGALIDVGACLSEVRGCLERLPLSGWSLETQQVMRGGLAGTKANVTVSPDGVARTLSVVTKILEAAELPKRIHERALASFTALAAAEGRVHGCKPDEVHFHELGAHDTLIDIVGTAAALEDLRIDEIYSSPITFGTGLMRGAHGTLPNPGPAVLALLEGVPAVGRDLDLELTTPTGAALLSANATGFGPLPAMTLEAVGYGAGTAEIEGLPNLTEVVIGTGTRGHAKGVEGQPLVVLEANLDDATGEQLSDAIEALLAKGARDAWVTPVLMKKGRPGHLVSALGDYSNAERLRAVLIEETGTFGVRQHVVERWAATRETVQVLVDGHTIALKVSAHRTKVEHDDAARAAVALGRPIRHVIAAALAEYRQLRPESD